MNGEIYIANNHHTNFKVHPAKFTMWLFLVAITMMFAAFTSAMLVIKPDALANDVWKTFEIPNVFNISTFIILLSSASLYWAYVSAKKDEIGQARIGLLLTTLLGIAFLFSQYEGYQALIENHIYISGNTEYKGKMVSPVYSSYFYVISGIHALHILGGVIFLISTLISAMRYKVHSRSMLKINLCATYWHFIGLLWVYLFALLNLYR